MSLIQQLDLDTNERFPWLVMGSAVNDFRKIYKGGIHSLSSLESIREFTIYYSRISNLDRLLVAEDVSLMPAQGRNILLKFAEETRLQLVLLGLFDGVDAVLLSRMRRVDKYIKEGVRSEFGGIKSGYEYIADNCSENEHYFSRLKHIAQKSPILYYYESEFGNKSYMKRFINYN